jgi:hypothetical protein
MADLTPRPGTPRQANGRQPSTSSTGCSLDPDYTDPETAFHPTNTVRKTPVRSKDNMPALQAADEGQWQQARQLFVQIQEAEPLRRR